MDTKNQIILTKDDILKKFKELTAEDNFLFKITTMYINKTDLSDYSLQFLINLYMQLKAQEQQED
ncbi:MAG: hypothetical protein ACYCT7_01690 [bacterium]